MPQSHPKVSENNVIQVLPEVLQQWPLPQPDAEADKNERGRILIVGGAPQMPGAVILAATAALRAGAGRLRIATVGSIATAVGVAVPEAYVVSLKETEAGGIHPDEAEKLSDLANWAKAVVIGPGMLDEENTLKLLQKFLPLIKKPTLLLDATSFVSLYEDATSLHRFDGNAVITPHAGEMASILKLEKDYIEANQLEIAQQASHKLGVVVALKGHYTYIAAPTQAPVYCNQFGNVGLAMSGSGDVLAGIIGGLLARGVEPHQAAVWGVYAHARAGDELAQKVGQVGYLARELLNEIPALLGTPPRSLA